jgi:hypothetical protein
MKIASYTAIAFSLFIINCTNTGIQKVNNQLNSYRPDTAKFNNELAKELASNPDSFTYKLEKYFVKNNREYLNINIERQSFKASVAVLVNNWDKMKGIKRTKGIGYSGAELKGLRLALSSPGQTDFVYQDLDRIID